MLLTDSEFRRLSSFIGSEVGIKMPDVKRTMLSGRLHKRLRALQIKNFSEYCDYLFSPDGREKELIHMIDAVTTNKTDFFREPSHFEYLVNAVLPDLIRKYRGRAGEPIFRIWSAGCSTGEEPYTLSMVLREFQEKNSDREFRFEILATDISSRVLEFARRAVYRHERIEAVPAALRRKYLLRGKGENRDMVRVVPQNRRMVNFRRLNFMESEFGFRERLDVIFCRNVIIYFDKKTQEDLMLKFCRHLNPGGYVFLGHSESLHGFDIPLTQIAPTIYRRS